MHASADVLHEASAFNIQPALDAITFRTKTVIATHSSLAKQRTNQTAPSPRKPSLAADFKNLTLTGFSTSAVISFWRGAARVRYIQ